MAKKAKIWTGAEWVDLSPAVADLSNYANLTTNQPSFRNFLINGGMDIAQRGTSITRGNVDGYTLDRWYASGYGSGQNFTISRSSATPPTGFQYFQRIATTTTSGTNLFISQSLETSNVVPMQGRTVTLSFRYRLPVNFTNAWTAQVYWSTATDANLTPATSKTSIASKTLTNTTSWTADSLTFVVPATATALSVEFITTGNVVNGAQFDFTGVQLELGSIATPFERRLIGAELALCQRYFCSSFQIGIAPANNLGSNASTGGNNLMTFAPTVGNSYSTWKTFPITMRRTADITIYNVGSVANTWDCYNSTGSVGNITPVITASSNGFTSYIQSNATITVANGAWAASAEL